MGQIPPRLLYAVLALDPTKGFLSPDHVTNHPSHVLDPP